MEDAADLKSAPREGVWVRIPSSAPASFSYENRPPEQFRGGLFCWRFWGFDSQVDSHGI